MGWLQKFVIWLGLTGAIVGKPFNCDRPSLSDRLPLTDFDHEILDLLNPRNNPATGKNQRQQVHEFFEAQERSLRQTARFINCGVSLMSEDLHLEPYNGAFVAVNDSHFVIDGLDFMKFCNTLEAAIKTTPVEWVQQLQPEQLTELACLAMGDYHSHRYPEVHLFECMNARSIKPQLVRCIDQIDWKKPTICILPVQQEVLRKLVDRIDDWQRESAYQANKAQGSENFYLDLDETLNDPGVSLKANERHGPCRELTPAPERETEGTPNTYERHRDILGDEQSTESKPRPQFNWNEQELRYQIEDLFGSPCRRQEEFRQHPSTEAMHEQYDTDDRQLPFMSTRLLGSRWLSRNPRQTQSWTPTATEQGPHSTSIHPSSSEKINQNPLAQVPGRTQHRKASADDIKNAPVTNEGRQNQQQPQIDLYLPENLRGLLHEILPTQHLHKTDLPLKVFQHSYAKVPLKNLPRGYQSIQKGIQPIIVFEIVPRGFDRPLQNTQPLLMAYIPGSELFSTMFWYQSDIENVEDTDCFHLLAPQLELKIRAMGMFQITPYTCGEIFGTTRTETQENLNGFITEGQWGEEVSPKELTSFVLAQGGLSGLKTKAIDFIVGMGGFKELKRRGIVKHADFESFTETILVELEATRSMWRYNECIDDPENWKKAMEGNTVSETAQKASPQLDANDGHYDEHTTGMTNENDEAEMINRRTELRQHGPQATEISTEDGHQWRSLNNENTESLEADTAKNSTDNYNAWEKTTGLRQTINDQSASNGTDSTYSQEDKTEDPISTTEDQMVDGDSSLRGLLPEENENNEYRSTEPSAVNEMGSKGLPDDVNKEQDIRNLTRTGMDVYDAVTDEPEDEPISWEPTTVQAERSSKAAKQTSSLHEGQTSDLQHGQRNGGQLNLSQDTQADLRARPPSDANGPNEGLPNTATTLQELSIPAIQLPTMQQEPVTSTEAHNPRSTTNNDGSTDAPTETIVPAETNLKTDSEDSANKPKSTGSQTWDVLLHGFSPVV